MQFSSDRKRKIVAVGISAAMLLGIVTACNIDYKGLSEGLNDLGNAMDFGYGKTPAAPETTSGQTVSETTAASGTTETAEPSVATETSETAGTSETSRTSETSESSSSSETSETSETTPSESSSETSESTTEETTASETTTEETTAVPTPTSTPAPTQHPSNERVDFSNLTNTKVSERFSVDTEEFSESVEGDGKAMAVFSGKRMAVSKAENDNVTEAVNLILDSFYKEAEGIYNRYAGEAKAAYNISGTVDNAYVTEVNFDYSFNKRILSVIMSYKATNGKTVLAEKEEYASFDMLTGQYVTLAAVANDWTGLQNALKVKLARNASISKASAITDLFVIAQQPGAQTATVEIYGMYNGQRIHTTGDMNEYAQFLNRYGKMIYGVSDAEPDGN